MGASLNSRQATSPAAYTLTSEYKTYIESLRQFLRTHESTRRISISPEVGNLHKFDLTSFLLTQAVPLEDHYMIMRMNNMTSRHEFDEYVLQLLVPDQLLVSQLKQAYRSKL